MHARRLPLIAIGACLLAAGAFVPPWVIFIITAAFAKSLAAIGLVVLFRCGLVSFGHGLFYCLGAYVPAVIGQTYGVTDAGLMVLGAVLLSVVAGAVIGLFLSGYRGVFFAMFNLALSMVLYGLIVKSHWLRGSDGIGLPPPTFLGAHASNNSIAIYALTAFCVFATVLLVDRYFRSSIGLRSLGVRDNEIRVEYLGSSARQVVFINYTISAALAGMGGALSAIATGHVAPELAYWTTSGEFVFIMVLSGYVSIAATVVASLLFEFIRLVAGQYAPHSWQIILGGFLLATILFVPQGLGSLTQMFRRPVSSRHAGEAPNV